MSMEVNMDPDTNKNLFILKNAVLCTDEGVRELLGPEANRLRDRYQKEGTSYFSVTLHPNFRGGVEDIARELNKVHTWLDNPVNYLISRIEGHIFLKSDYILCTEGRVKLVDYSPFVVKVPPSKEELRQISDYREDIELFKEAIDMIKELAGDKYYKD